MKVEVKVSQDLCVILLLQTLGQPIQDRHREHEDRPRAFEELGKKIQLCIKFVDSYKQKVSLTHL